MSKYDELIKELEQLPRIDTSFAYVGGNILTDGKKFVDATEIRWSADTEEQLKEKIVHSLCKLFEGKKVWVRLLPVIRYIEEERQWYGRARFAVIPNE